MKTNLANRLPTPLILIAMAFSLSPTAAESKRPASKKAETKVDACQKLDQASSDGPDGNVGCPVKPKEGEWWVAIGSWTSDDGSGNPSFAAWLYDRDGNLVGSSGTTDPNTVGATVGAFASPRADNGLAVGVKGNNLSNRHFDGKMAAVRLYDQAVGEAAAATLDEELAIDFSSDALAE